MIWGLAIGPGQMFSCILDEEVHLSLAALESRPDHDEGSKYSQVVLKTKDSEQLLCTLVQGTIFQQSLDLKLMPREKVSFSVQGSGIVYITGYSYSSPIEEYVEDEETPAASEAVEQEAETEADQEELITEVGMSVNIKDEPIQMVQEDSFHVQETTPEDLAEPSTRAENGKVEVGAADEDDNTHPVAEIAEKEPDFSVAAGTSGTMWLDSRVPMYNTEEAQLYPESTDNETDINLTDPQEQTGFQQVSHSRSEPKTSSQEVYTAKHHVINTRDHRLSNLPPQVSAAYQTTTTSHGQNFYNRKKPVMCRFCRMTFGSYELKRTHEATHTEYKAYQCLYCVKSFKSHGHREQHERIHTGVKPYNCRICSKGFTQSGDRNRHERIHTVRKTFQCQCCLKSFRSFKYLLVHERSKHGLISSSEMTDLSDASSRSELTNLTKATTGQHGGPRGKI